MSDTKTREFDPSGEPATGEAARSWPLRYWTLSLICVLAVLVGGVFVAMRQFDSLHTHQAATGVPQSAAMEQRFGVRFSRIAVVGDGGLITLSYVVLDGEKATAFQADRDHPPTLRSEARQLSTNRVSIMRNGHLMRPGATYYFVFQNTRSALRPGETATIEYGGLRLTGFPVL